MMERLCFGTFIDVLVHCTKARVNKTLLTGAIIHTIDPDSKYMDKSDSACRALNHLYKCTGDFTLTYSNIVQLAPTLKREDLVQQFKSNVIELFDTDKREQAILTLCDIIKKDATLNYESGGENVVKFQSYIGKNLKNLLNDNEYILSDFLAGILLYTVSEIKNTVGKEWLKAISEEYPKYDEFFENYVNGFKDLKNTIHVWNTAVDRKTEQGTKKETEQIQESMSTPSDQMLDIFKQAVAEHNIVAYLCNVADYLCDEPFYSGDIFSFINTIQAKILNKFVNNQDEEIFKNITSFNVALKSYCCFLDIIRTSVSEYYGFMWRMSPCHDGILSLIKSDKDEVKKALLEEDNKTASLSESNSLLELETKINQLNFIESIFSCHKEISDIFKEICVGKTLLVY